VNFRIARTGDKGTPIIDYWGTKIYAGDLIKVLSASSKDRLVSASLTEFRQELYAYQPAELKDFALSDGFIETLTQGG
jgi:hypothetical protein